MTMLNRLGRQGGTLRLAAGADLDLPSILIDGSGKYQLLALPGARRPRLRLRAMNDLQALLRRLDRIGLAPGSLHLQGIDLVVPDQDMARADRLAVAGLLPNTELTMTDCTVTLAANRPGPHFLWLNHFWPRKLHRRPTGFPVPVRSFASATLSCGRAARAWSSRPGASSIFSLPMCWSAPREPWCMLLARCARGGPILRRSRCASIR